MLDVTGKGLKGGTMNERIYEKAYSALKMIYGEDATFREGQYEAIEATITHRRTLVVQRTGWGKSLVYFISAKLMEGVTVIISPLLALMDNQREAAESMGLRCLVLNSRVKAEAKDTVLERLTAGDCDIFFTTPETLFTDDVQKILPDLNIGLFVIDECHCISDWGHDFRLQYGNLRKIITMLPEHVGVLGTTATANDRVIEDLKEQFGNDVFVSRGPLTRESLHIDILKLESAAERIAWMELNIPRLPGSGIIYCLTRRDCDNISEYLNRHGIEARPYYSDSKLDEINPQTGMSFNEETEWLFMENHIKVIVATIKLGMGYDKEDIGFVIHFQRPSSLVAYYQQIGRAGRKDGSEAFCFMMTGNEDRQVNEYFINNAFPTENQELAIISALEQHPDGLGKTALDRYSNISSSTRDKTLMFLMDQGVIYRDDHKKYHRSMNPYIFRGNYYDEVRRTKMQELDAMDRYAEEKGCLSRYIVSRLNDYSASDCGKCRNCLGHDILEGLVQPDEESILEAQKWLNHVYIRIEPKKRWPDRINPFDENTKISKPNRVGVALAKYGDAGYGAMVAHDKYHAEAYRDALVEKSAEVVEEMINGDRSFVITSIPSGRNKKVGFFAEELARKLGLAYMELLQVTGKGEQQKSMQNSYHQYKNAVDKLALKSEAAAPENIILVDDMVDSKWTLTVAGGLLTGAGAENVIPFCLADSSNSGD